MDAGWNLRRWVIGIVTGSLILCVLPSPLLAANARTQNFLVHAPSPQLAQDVGKAAEKFRRELAIHWLGAPLPAWPAPCPIRVVAGPNLAAQGVTTYNPAPVRDFQMEVIGTPERILDSVLPHEVTHTILATYFGRPLPRWADEGICTTVEHVSERSKHEAKLREFLRSRRGIAMNQLFLMTEYPADVLPMYAQGYSVCRFLIDQKGPQQFIQFLKDYMRNPSWTANVKKHYEYDSLAELQQYWLAWVSNGSGKVEKFVKVDAAPHSDGKGPNAGLTGRTLPAPSGSAIGSTASATLADATRPGRDAVALASNTKGWYQRNRLQAQARQQLDPASRTPATNPRPMAIDSLIPPSVVNSGPYQSAHPQPEQQISRGGVSVSGIPSSSQRYR